MSGLVVVALVLRAGFPGLSVSTETCGRVDRLLLEKQLVLELKQAPPAPTKVLIRCEERRALLVVERWATRLESSLPLDDVPNVALTRTLALAAAELVFALPEAPPPEVVPDRPVVTEPAVVPPRFALSAAGGVELALTGALLGVVRLGLQVRLVQSLWLGADAVYARTGRTVPQGSLTGDVLEGSLRAGWHFEVATLRFPVGAGVRVGNAWLSARAQPGVEAGAVSGLRLTPFVFGGAGLVLTDALVLSLEVQLGWQLRGVRGLVDAAPALELTGPVGQTTLGLAVIW